MGLIIWQCFAHLFLFGAGTASAQDGESDLSPVFSVSRGFYRTPFDLTIIAQAQAAVKYTLDGSDPKTSSTAQRAATPLVLRRVGMDPALGSAVIVTTIADVVGFLIFLGIASALVSTLV